MALLAIEGLRKSFEATEVLRGIDLAVERGEVLALVGENGAGKSTLMRVVGGYTPPGAGTLAFEGAPLPGGVDAAEARGIVLVHQEFNLAPHLTVAENVFLGRERMRGPFIDRAGMERDTREALAQLGCSAPPRTRLADLSVSDWQMVELAKALNRRPKLLLMDEPTAVLSAPECGRLFACIEAFRADGGSVVFTSHKLDEVKRVADRVAVLRDGEIVRIAPAGALTEHGMATLMVGRPLSDLYPEKPARPSDAAPLLEVEDLRSPGHVAGASFALRPGEVVGVAGLVGSGRTECFEALLGLRPATAGRFRLRGADRALPGAREAWTLGLAYLTEDRKGKGLLLDKGLRENLLLTEGALSGGPTIDDNAERAALEEAVAAFSIRARDRGAPVRALSGGNQQKLLVAKTLRPGPELVVFDEPTRGVDIGSKQGIYRVIAGLAARGRCCVVISSEMAELIGLCHRVVVMRRGRTVGEVAGERMTEQEIVRLAMGLEEAAYV